MGTPIPGLDDEEEDEAQATHDIPLHVYEHSAGRSMAFGGAAGQVPLPPLPEGASFYQVFEADGVW